jgi:uncharacterized membrane protein
MIGIFFVLVAIPSYSIVPTLFTGFMSKFSGGDSPTPMASQIFSQLGIPPIDAIVKYIQYSLIGLIVAGIFLMAFGIMAKKIQKQPSVALSVDSSQKIQEQENTNFKALHLLQERLAKGEITSSQYLSLKKVLEDKV